MAINLKRQPWGQRTFFLTEDFTLLFPSRGFNNGKLNRPRWVARQNLHDRSGLRFVAVEKMGHIQLHLRAPSEPVWPG